MRNTERVTAERWSYLAKNGLPRTAAARYLKERFGVGSSSLLAKQPRGLKFYKRGLATIYGPDDLDAFGLSLIRQVQPGQSEPE